MTDEPVILHVNGAPREIAAPPEERLLDTLRWRLGLRGTKEGCRSGDCGACTVLVDDRPTLSCLTLTAEIPGTRVETIESIGEDPGGKLVQEAFRSESALQCGYCTPGFIVTLTGLLREGASPRSADALWEDLHGNLCRCTGYAAIRRAVERAAREAP
jgi:carbon-monoxide dehydrogenase small subunit